ncbi:uncharacterized protein LOC131942208 [Physella acuta]|uniref:uncharacterized protein LOC131942208 n=1 Tax=Physella acuta TaxID=109671 RepID=UPI0027DC32F8|nr:uncharacterized protein LOC131942208 [Physella acuta]XP_059157925.1 uncharacterized protein LOC131942208 [Physella acuta]XP_059157926.1 uncharacterized protein LOC131942208 [Physella acuta]
MEPSAGLLTSDRGGTSNIATGTSTVATGTSTVATGTSTVATGTSTVATEESTVDRKDCNDKNLEEDEDKKSPEQPEWLTSTHVTSQLEESDDGGDTEDDDDVTEEETEMSREEKREMYQAVRCGDIDLLEDCLDRPNSDLNMTWFQENLLMAAIRHHQREMAEFLLDNGINHDYTTTIVNLRETSAGKVLDQYELTSRQMAYDRGMAEVVELIDRLQGHVFPFVRPSPRTPRYRRPRPPTPSLSETSSQGADVSSGSDDSLAGGSVAGGRRKLRRKKKQSLDMAKPFDTQNLDIAKPFDTQNLDMAKPFDTHSIDMARRTIRSNSSTRRTLDVKAMEEKTMPAGQAKSPQRKNCSVFLAPQNNLLARKKCTSVLQPRPHTAHTSVLQPQTAHTSVLQPRPQTAHTSVLQPQTAHTSVLQPRPQTAHTSVLQPQTAHTSVLQPQTAHTSVVQQRSETAKLWTQNWHLKRQTQTVGCRKVTAPGSYRRECAFWHRSPAQSAFNTPRVRSPDDVNDQSSRPSRNVTDQHARPKYDVTSQAAPLPIRGILKSPTQPRLAADVPARSNKKSTLYHSYLTTTKRKLDPTFSSFYRALDFHGNKAIKHVTMSHSSFYGP